jgi:hypothetical protein
MWASASERFGDGIFHSEDFNVKLKILENSQQKYGKESYAYASIYPC